MVYGIWIEMESKGLKSSYKDKKNDNKNPLFRKRGFY